MITPKKANQNQNLSAHQGSGLDTIEFLQRSGQKKRKIAATTLKHVTFVIYPQRYLNMNIIIL